MSNGLPAEQGPCGMPATEDAALPSRLNLPPHRFSVMAQRSLPNIGQLAAQMSANHSRVVRSIDHLMAPIDEMVQASTDGNWSRVAELGRQLSQDSRQAGYRGVSVMAQVVANEAARPDNAHGVRRSLIRLIGTYGRTTRSHATCD